MVTKFVCGGCSCTVIGKLNVFTYVKMCCWKFIKNIRSLSLYVYIRGRMQGRSNQSGQSGFGRTTFFRIKNYFHQNSFYISR